MEFVSYAHLKKSTRCFKNTSRMFYNTHYQDQIFFAFLFLQMIHAFNCFQLHLVIDKEKNKKEKRSIDKV